MKWFLILLLSLSLSSSNDLVRSGDLTDSSESAQSFDSTHSINANDTYDVNYGDYVPGAGDIDYSIELNDTLKLNYVTKLYSDAKLNKDGQLDSTVELESDVELEDTTVDLTLKGYNRNVNYKESWIDNVFFSYYKPMKGFNIGSVVYYSREIWRRVNEDEKCNYLLVAYKGGEPLVLYVLREDDETMMDSYFKNFGGVWRRVEYTDYLRSVKTLSATKGCREVTIFLGEPERSEGFSSIEYQAKYPVRYVTVNYGYKCWRVYHLGVIWKARDKDSRCVAAWGYRLDGKNVGFVQLLIMHDEVGSEFLSYLFVLDGWQLLDQSKEFDYLPSLRHPDSFLHPEFEFTDKRTKVRMEPFKPEPGRGYLTVNYNPSVLHLEPQIVNEFAFCDREFYQDVLYLRFQPKGPAAIRHFLESANTLWEAYLDETLHYALVAYDDRIQAYAYVVVKVLGEMRSAYFAKARGGWHRVSGLEYLVGVERIKSKIKSHLTRNFDLHSGFKKSYYNLRTGKDYSYYTPKPAVLILMVSYLGKKLWASKQGEYCSAIWAYEDGSYYLFALLITYFTDSTQSTQSMQLFQYEKSEIKLYYKIDGQFHEIEEIVPRESESDGYYFVIDGIEYNVGESHYKKALNPVTEFNFPGHDLCPFVPELPLTYPTQHYRSIYETGFVFHRELGVKEYMQSFTPKTIHTEDCTLLDISEPDDTVEVTEAIFDYSLKVKFIQPTPGKYFYRITEGKRHIYARVSNTEASVGVSIYHKNGENILADVMLAQSSPASIHLLKEDGVWKFVDERKFKEKVHELKLS